MPSAPRGSFHPPGRPPGLPVRISARIIPLLLPVLLLWACAPVVNDDLPTDPVLVDADGDGVTVAEGDCDDGDRAIFPGATEACSGEDSDCDGAVDEGFDSDGDGVSACESAPGAFDCDDGDPSRAQGMAEVCDAKDNDCDSRIDEDPAFDEDGDGYLACRSATAEGVPIPLDCDDGDAGVNPGAAERCNGEDDDCDGLIDSDDEEVTGATLYYADADHDGFGDPESTTLACALPEGYDDAGTDCDDGDGDVYPGAAERCNGDDDDCDEAADEGLDIDGDGDGALACAGGVAPDCDDGDDAIYPGAEERCDGVDQDCDSNVDEDFDGDRDGFVTCGASPDCDDTDALAYPGAAERCDGKDSNCLGGAGDYRVDKAGDGEFTTIQGAMDAAARDCVITVAPGIYVETVDFLGKAVTLVSEEGPTETILNVTALAPAPAVIFNTGESSRAVLEGFTIRADKGETSQYGDVIKGGAIYLGTGVAAVIRGNIIERSTADQGGAIACLGCIGARLEGNVIQDNTAYRYVFLGNYSYGEGGALYVESGEMSLSGNTFKSNTAQLAGGAIAIKQGLVTLDGDTLESNSAAWGGGIFARDGDIQAEGATFRANKATGFSGSSTWDSAEGGGIYADDGAAVVVADSVFIDNLAQGGVSVGFGGGVLIYEGALDLQRTYFDGGVSLTSGGGVYCGKSDLTMRNNLLTGSRSNYGGGAYVSQCTIEEIANNTFYQTETQSLTEASASLDVVASMGPIFNNDLSADRSGYGFIYEADAGSGDPVPLPAQGFAFNNVFGNHLGNYGPGVADLTGQEGNISAAPAYIDPAGEDFHPGPGSPLIDAGRPEVEDADGSTSDIGAYGGPGGDWTIGGAPPEGAAPE